MARAKGLRIEDYGLVGDGTTAALVGRDGSVDWLCWPRFDSDACFAALLGTEKHGHWSLAPAAGGFATSRRYRGDTLVLETLFETAEGSVAVIDFMPVRRDGLSCDGRRREGTSLVRIVEGRSGEVAMRMHLTLRFGYGSAVPWVTRLHPADDEATAPGGITAIAGPNLVTLRAPVRIKGEDHSSGAVFTVKEGERIPFVLAYGPSHRPPPEPFDPVEALADTEAAWNAWAERCTYRGPHRDKVLRSLLTLKALIYSETGGIVAAATTSLPEQIGGPRNWDYRYCWLRDAAFSLFALMGGGYYEEALAWRDWLQRAVAGNPENMQIMYGLAGERRLDEWEVPWLPGYEGSRPVRIGNAASEQLQLDVYGEVIGALHLARDGGIATNEAGWALERTMLKHLKTLWREPDEGIWEVRGGRRHFTFSKVGAWSAFDRAIMDAERYRLHAPVEEWKAVREEIRADVLEHGFDKELNSFVQSYGSKELDASVLLLALSGFVEASDPRMLGTVAAIESRLMEGGFVLRYRAESGADGLSGDEGVFLPCSFWLAVVYHLQGRQADAEALFERVAGLANDLGLLSEEYDVPRERQVGNLPQAFTHEALVNTALQLWGERGMVGRR